MEKISANRVERAHAAIEYVLKSQVQGKVTDQESSGRVSLAAVLDAAGFDLAPDAAARDVALMVDRRNHRVFLGSCGASLEYCLSDLLGTLIGLMPKHGSIALSARPGSTAMVIQVRYGWPIFHRTRLSRPFTRRWPRNNPFQNSIAETICEMEGWNLVFDHDSLLGGTVEVQVPKSCLHRPADDRPQHTLLPSGTNPTRFNADAF